MVSVSFHSPGAMPSAAATWLTTRQPAASQVTPTGAAAADRKKVRNVRYCARAHRNIRFIIGVFSMDMSQV